MNLYALQTLFYRESWPPFLEQKNVILTTDKVNTTERLSAEILNIVLCGKYLTSCRHKNDKHLHPEFSEP